MFGFGLNKMIYVVSLYYWSFLLLKLSNLITMLGSFLKIRKLMRAVLTLEKDIFHREAENSSTHSCKCTTSFVGTKALSLHFQLMSTSLLSATNTSVLAPTKASNTFQFLLWIQYKTRRYYPNILKFATRWRLMGRLNSWYVFRRAATHSCACAGKSLKSASPAWKCISTIPSLSKTYMLHEETLYWLLLLDAWNV